MQIAEYKTPVFSQSEPRNVRLESKSRIFITPFGANVNITRSLSESEQRVLEFATLNYSFVLKAAHVRDECGCLMAQGAPIDLWCREIRRVYAPDTLYTAIVLDLLESL